VHRLVGLVQPELVVTISANGYRSGMAFEQPQRRPYPVLGWLVSPMRRTFLLQMCRCTLTLISPVSTKLPISSIIPPD